MRRAEYGRGAGHLHADAARLLFVIDGAHPAVAHLEEASRSDTPGRALAAAVTKWGDDLPAFVFLRIGERMQGIVCGEVAVEVDDGMPLASIDGVAAEPWAHLDASSDATVTCGTSETDCPLWIERGVVNAGGFRWSRRRGTEDPIGDDSGEDSIAGGSSVTPARRSVVSSYGPRSPDIGTRVAPSVEADPAAASVDAVDVEPAPERTSVLQALGAEFDNTIDAIQFAEIRADQNTPEPARARGRKRTVGPPDSRTTLPLAGDPAGKPARTLAGQAGNDAADDETIDLGPGQVMLGGLHVERRMVKALVCLGCDTPNPPIAARCRYCAALLSSTNTDIRQVPQPVLGVIQLSGGREELLDADLLIGRNPGYWALDRYQRAVVHAENDRSVSRRHLELRLDQWRVLAVSLKPGPATTVKSGGGRHIRLSPKVPHQLRAGDTLQYGSAWLRFEPEEQA
ncbi:MAG: hypothetical protein OXC00_04225 [Acidimicrobiaceae bacterium]|nr:hypothetical protein [Acidimicrobiaceae bacterium]